MLSVEARWVRWVDGVLEVGGEGGPASTVVMRAERLTLVGGTFAPLAHRSTDGRRLLVAARFPSGASLRVERRDDRTALAASPEPCSKASGQ